MKKVLLFILFPYLLYGQTQIGQDIDGEAIDDRSGTSVSVSSDGSIVAIGAPFNDENGNASGQVRVYENQSGTWTQIGQDIDGGIIVGFSGRSVSISSDGTIIAIGANESNENGTLSGQVRIYENLNDVWTQIGQDINGDMFDFLGTSVSISSDGNIVAIGVPQVNVNDTTFGEVRVYENQNNTWVQVGQDIIGEALGDRLGISVSISSDGSIVAAGAITNDGNGSDSGHVRVYENQNDTWVQIGQDINGGAMNDFFGRSVSISSDGDIVAIGATQVDVNGINSGQVQVYENQGGIWTQIGQNINGEAEFDMSGSSVSISPDGNIIAIGAPNSLGGNSAGGVRVFGNQGGTWIQIGQDIDGETIDDTSGESVSISSNGVLAIGAPLNDGNGVASGHVRVYDLSDLLSIDDSNLSGIRLYPNPTSNNAYIELEGGMKLVQINIYNNIGQIISVTKNLHLDLFQLTEGIYFVEIITEKGKTTQKLIKS